MTDIDPTQIRRNAYTDNLGEDLIAVDALGSVLARAGDRASLDKAAPDHAGVFTAADLEPKAKKPAPKPKDEPAPVVEETPAPIAAADEQPVAEEPKAEETPVAEEPKAEEAPAADEQPVEETPENPLDHAGDGKAGGSRKRKPAKDAE